jgi:hypothetical protein
VLYLSRIQHTTSGQCALQSVSVFTVCTLFNRELILKNIVILYAQKLPLYVSWKHIFYKQLKNPQQNNFLLFYCVKNIKQFFTRYECFHNKKLLLLNQEAVFYFMCRINKLKNWKGTLRCPLCKKKTYFFFMFFFLLYKSHWFCWMFFGAFSITGWSCRLFIRFFSSKTKPCMW